MQGRAYLATVPRQLARQVPGVCRGAGAGERGVPKKGIGNHKAGGAEWRLQRGSAISTVQFSPGLLQARYEGASYGYSTGARV